MPGVPGTGTKFHLRLYTVTNYDIMYIPSTKHQAPSDEDESCVVSLAKIRRFFRFSSADAIDEINYTRLLVSQESYPGTTSLAILQILQQADAST
jgi:hypothetical protein